MDVQSIGAPIQTMLLAATDMGLGTLWICDVFYAHRTVRVARRAHQLVAAVSVGYPDEEPKARPRMTVDQVTRWI